MFSCWMISTWHDAQGLERRETNLELVGSMHELRFHVQVRLPVLQERALLLPAELCGFHQLQDGRPQARDAVVSAKKKLQPPAALGTTAGPLDMNLPFP